MNNNTSTSTGAPSVPQPPQKKPTIPAPPPPPKEDEVQDSGDAINTFASYIPTGLPQSVIKILQERAQACNISNDTTSTKTFSGNSNLVDLSIDNTKKDDDNNSIIEILDTDNEDSRMGMEDITNIADTKTNVLDQKQPSSSDTKPSNNIQIAHELFTSGKIQSHTSPAVESALLSSVSAPLVPNEACETILPLLKEGKLSPLQAEGVSLAVSRFNRVFVSKGSGKGDGSMRAG